MTIYGETKVIIRKEGKVLTERKDLWFPAIFFAWGYDRYFIDGKSTNFFYEILLSAKTMKVKLLRFFSTLELNK